MIWNEMKWNDNLFKLLSYKVLLSWGEIKCLKWLKSNGLSVQMYGNVFVNKLYSLYKLYCMFFHMLDYNFVLKLTKSDNSLQIFLCLITISRHLTEKFDQLYTAL